MAYWPGLIFAPALFLSELSLVYALVPWSCAHQQPAVLHAVVALSVLACLGACALAWRDVRRAGGEPEHAPHAAHERRDVTSVTVEQRSIAAAARDRFLSMAGLLSALLFTMALAWQWVTQLVVSPCMS